MSERLVILGSDAEALKSLAVSLQDVATIAGIVVERPVSRRKIFARRIRTFGLSNAVGQALFVLGMLPLIRIASRARIRELTPRDERSLGAPIQYVASVNTSHATATIAALAPTLILVYGARIIKGTTLAAVGVPFINIHAGITPWYRGGQGAYWALYNREPERAGVTVHRVDTGIDTGHILAQAPVVPTAQDTIATYPFLQLDAAIELLHALLHEGTASWKDKPIDATSKETLYAHPTIWQYLEGRMRGVK